MDPKQDQEQSAPVYPETGALASSENGIKKSGKILTIIFAIIAIAGIGFGAYGLFLKPEKSCSCPDCIAEKPKEPKEAENKEPNEQTEETQEVQPTSKEPSAEKQIATKSSLDLSRFKTNVDTNEIYTIIFPSTGFHNATTTFAKNDIGEWFVSRQDTGEQILNLSGEPVQITIGAMGVDDGGARALFILEDGTVEYFKLINERGEQNTEFTIKKYEGLNNIVRFHQVYDRIEGVPGGGYTVIAEDRDGYYYDLKEFQ